MHFQYIVEDGIKEEKNGFYVKIIHQYLSSQEHNKNLLRENCRQENFIKMYIECTLKTLY